MLEATSDVLPYYLRSGKKIKHLFEKSRVMIKMYTGCFILP